MVHYLAYAVFSEAEIEKLKERLEPYREGDPRSSKDLFDNYRMGGRFAYGLTLKPEADRKFKPMVESKEESCLDTFIAYKGDIDFKAMETEGLQGMDDFLNAMEEIGCLSRFLKSSDSTFRKAYLEERKSENFCPLVVWIGDEVHSQYTGNGMVGDRIEQAEWYQTVRSLLDSVPDDYVVLILDCHI